MSTPSPATPIALLEALSALQTADAALRWRLRERLGLRANEIVAVELLDRLEAVGQPVRTGDVARSLGVTAGGATMIIARLMRLGLVDRTDNPRDGRGHHLHLTAAARTALADALGDSRSDLQSFLAGLSPRESKRMIVLMTAMTASLDSGAVAPAA